MNASRKYKLQIILFCLTILFIVAGLVLYSLRQNISLFYSPTQIAAGEAPLNHPIRIGGMVKNGSFIRDSKELLVHFVITDYVQELVVEHQGILPDLFREGQGVVVEGYLLDTTHAKATRVLAKHDENYMPPEVRHVLAQKVKS